MHQVVQPPFTVPGTDLSVMYHGTFEGPRWSDGQLADQEGERCYPVEDGIPVFVPPEDQTWPQSEIDKWDVTEEWIGRKMEQYRNGELYSWAYPPVRADYCRQMAASGGLILELATGPDGGNMPFALLHNPEAVILANELGHNVLKAWRAHQKQSQFAPNLSFACFDASEMPLGTGSIDIISSNGVFTEIRRTGAALREAYRVLKRGGAMYLFEYPVVPETAARLPQNLKRQFGFPKKEHADLMTAAGFDVVSVDRCSEISMPAEWGSLPEAAAQHGVTLKVQVLAIQGRKA